MSSYSIHAHFVGRAPGSTSSALPSDLVDLILSHLARRHLLHVASFVCRQWRHSALRCLRELTLHDFDLRDLRDRTASMLALLPRLTTVNFATYDIGPLPQELVLPASVTSVRFSVAARAPHSLDGLVVPSLKELHLCNLSAAEIRMLHNSASTLERLVACWPLVVDRYTQVVGLHLPRLVSLHANAAWDAPDFFPLLARHASQLTELSVTGHAAPLQRSLIDAFAALPFGRLRTLRLEQTPHLAVTDLTRLIRGATRLRTLVVTDAPQILQLPRPLLRRLTAYHTPKEPLSQADAAVLDALPRLRELSIGQREVTALLSQSARTLSRLSALRLVPSAETPESAVWAVLAKTASITSLRLDCPSPLTRGPHLEPGVLFDRLREVTLDFVHSATCDGVATTASHLLPLAPHLGLLRVKLRSRTLPGHFSPLIDVLYALLQRGTDVHIAGLQSAGHESLLSECKNLWGELKFFNW